MAQDDLHGIVQRMIDAGESEENIATVIQHFSGPTASPTMKPVSDSEPGTWLGGVGRSLKQQFSEAAGPMPAADEMPFTHATSPGVQEAMNTPLVRPTGIDAVDGFTSPAGLAMTAAAGGMALQHIPKVQRFTGRVLQGLGNLDVTHPLKSTVGWAGDALERSAARAGSPNATWTQQPDPPAAPAAPAPRPGAPPPAAPPVAAQGLSQAERTALARQGYPPDLIAKIEATAGGQPPMPQGRMRMGPASAPPPIQVDPASLPQSWRDLPHPLDPQRVDVGAEVTGRAHGMTKQAVRDVATPILDAKPGEASPILPEASLGRIIDTLKAMPPGSAEREAYVARATSGKAQWQIENIRRTLEHLGLIVPIAATGADAVRESVMKRLRGGSEPAQNPQGR